MADIREYLRDGFPVMVWVTVDMKKPKNSADWHIDGNEYKITALGNIAEKNLESLGHVTIVFDGATEASLPGSIYVKGSSVPKLSIGSEILIRK